MSKQMNPHSKKREKIIVWSSLIILFILFLFAYPLSFIFTLSDITQSPNIFLKKEFTSFEEINEKLSAELDPNAQIIIVEFGDFECEFCKQAQTLVTKFESDKRIQVVFAHYPSNLHPNAYFASVAYECLRQGGVVEAKLALYNAKELSNQTIIQIAQNLGLNMTDAQTLANCDANAQIRKDITFGNELGIRGTPTFMIFETSDPKNYELIEGANEPQFQFYLDKWLK
jgi:thiol-disulfide isomerase/thioredoxin